MTVDRPSWHNASIESAIGPLDELTSMWQTFMADAYENMFHIAVCFLWLEKQLLFNGKRRIRRFRSGRSFDALFARYMSDTVGRDQAIMTRSRWFQMASLVVPQIYKDFFLHNPFEEPEYYRWPFKHAGVDFLAFVYQVDNYMELLQFAEEKKMSYRDFKNWAANYVLCYNDEQGQEIYKIGMSSDLVPRINKIGWDYTKFVDAFDYLPKNESEKAKADRDDKHSSQT